jgi:hypothetical protein
MAVTPVAAYTTVVAKGDGASPEVFATILSMSAVSVNPLTAPSLDATGYGDVWPVKIAPGQKSSGQVSCTIHLDLGDVTHAAVRAQWTSQAAGSYKITFPGATPSSYTMSAFVTDWAVQVERNGIMMASFTLQPAGAVTVV